MKKVKKRVVDGGTDVEIELEALFQAMTRLEERVRRLEEERVVGDTVVSWTNCFRREVK